MVSRIRGARDTNALMSRTFGAGDLLQMLLSSEGSLDAMTLPAFERGL
jgi:hypothetical protein